MQMEKRDTASIHQLLGELFPLPLPTGHDLHPNHAESLPSWRFYRQQCLPQHQNMRTAEGARFDEIGVRLTYHWRGYVGCCLSGSNDLVVLHFDPTRQMQFDCMVVVLSLSLPFGGIVILQVVLDRIPQDIHSSNPGVRYSAQMTGSRSPVTGGMYD